MAEGAPFNPEPPQVNAPVTAFWPQRIQDLKYDKSKEIGIEGAAKLMKGGAEVAEQFTEQNILHQEHTGLDTINQEAIERLSAAKANPSLIYSDPTANMPSEIQKLPQTVDALDAARANNKLSKTYIDMQKNALAKDLRHRYPAHRDFVDQTFAHSNREDPANVYVTSMIGDINSLMTGMQAQRNKVESLVIEGVKKGYAGFDVLADKWRKGQLGNDPDKVITDQYYKAAHQQLNMENAERQIKLAIGNHELAGFKAQDAAAVKRSQITSSVFDSMHLNLGTKEMLTTQALPGAQRGQVEMTDTEAIQGGQQILGGSVQALEMFRRWGDEVVDEKTGQTRRGVMGPNKWKEEEQALSQSFKDQADLVTHKELGLAYRAHNYGEAVASETVAGILKNKSTRDYMATTMAIAKYPELKSLLTGTSYPDVSPAFNAYFDFTDQRAVTLPPVLPEDHEIRKNQSIPDGKPITLNKDIEEIQTHGANPSIVDQFTQGKLKLIDAIANPKIPDDAKISLTKYAFNPANWNIINRVSEADRPAFYNQLFSDGNTKAIHKLSLSRPDASELWTDYSRMAHYVYGNNMLHPEVQDLNEVPASKNVSVSYDGERNQFKAHLWNQGRAIGPLTAKGLADSAEQTQDRAIYERVNDSIERLNIGLRRLSAIAKAEGSNVNAYLYEFLTSAGLDPNSQAGGMVKATRGIKPIGEIMGDKE